MVRRALVTAIYGGFDAVNPAPSTVEAFLFTESQRTADEAEEYGWTPVVVPLRPGQTPRMASKWPKLHPLAALPGYPLQVWIDGSMWPSERVVELFDFGPFAAWRHPWQPDIRAEATEALEASTKYRAYDLHGQVDAYEADGHPVGWGMWENGVHVRDLSDDRVRAMFDAWAAEVDRWGPECQISLPYVARKHGVTIADLPGSLRGGNPWVRMALHLRAD